MRRLKRRILSHPRLVRLGIILVILISFFSLLYYFFSPVPDSSLVKTDGPVNILLLGVGDTGHDGPNLTDTMIVITASPGGALTMISIPRDIYLDSLQNKINAAYAAGGLNLAKDAAAQVTGLPINYAVKVDISAFEKSILTFRPLLTIRSIPLTEKKMTPVTGTRSFSAAMKLFILTPACSTWTAKPR